MIMLKESLPKYLLKEMKDKKSKGKASKDAVGNELTYGMGKVINQISRSSPAENQYKSL